MLIDFYLHETGLGLYADTTAVKYQTRKRKQQF